LGDVEVVRWAAWHGAVVELLRTQTCNVDSVAARDRKNSTWRPSESRPRERMVVDQSSSQMD
jgi:hypothetical protein